MKRVKFYKIVVSKLNQDLNQGRQLASQIHYTNSRHLSAFS